MKKQPLPTPRGRLPRGYKKRLLAELRDHVVHGVPFDLTFKPFPARGTRKERERLQQALEDAFCSWADTWIYPWIDHLEELLDR